jgi:hypothetical protein
VIWSDETRVHRVESVGDIWGWVAPEPTSTENTTRPIMRFGGGSILLWGCMTMDGLGYCCKIEGNMDAELYTNILSDELVRTMEYYGLDAGHVMLQHDNDPKHTSRQARE